MIAVALLWWRGELRAQRLLSRRPAVTLILLAFPLAVLSLLAYGVHKMLAGGSLPLTNIALLTPVCLLLIFVGVLVTSEESSARVQDVCAWAAPRPVSGQQLRRLLLATGLLRGVLFTLAFACVAIGALTVPGTWATRAQVICTGILLPLPFVAGALLFGARWRRGLNPAFISVPLGLVVIGTATRLPSLHGVPGRLVQVLAAPGLTLLGRSPAATGALVIGAWLAASVWLLSRLDRGNISLAGVSSRPPRAWRLARPDRPRVVLDLITHQISLRDAAEMIPLTGLLAVAAVIATSAGRGHALLAAVFTVALLAWPAASIGYRQLRAATALPRTAWEWLLQTPLPVRKLPWTRHLVCACGAAVSCAIFLSLLGAARLAGVPMPLGPLVAAATAPLCLTGWLAVALSWHGWARLGGYYLLGQYVVLRGVAVVLFYLAHWPATVAVALLMTDVALGAAGHFAARLALRRRS